jgi:hypothetical protein
MRRVSIITAAAGIGITMFAPAANAAGETAATPQWVPYRTQPFDSANVCSSFTVHGDIVRDEEETRTDATYADGSPRVEEFRGPLVIAFTNTSNGRSVVRDVSGYALLRFRRDGSSTWFFNGGGSIGVHLGNRTTPPGSYIVTGRFVLQNAADGTRTIRPIHASVENLCTTLA